MKEELTFEKAKELHRELWGWLAETGNLFKWDHPKHDEWKSKYIGFHGCFPCTLSNFDCTKCPIDSEHIGSCRYPYEEWSSAQTPKTRKEYAAMIRDWEWKELGK